MQDDQLQPFHWKTARITELYKGADGVARVAKIKLPRCNVFTRPVSKLYNQQANFFLQYPTILLYFRPF